MQDSTYLDCENLEALRYSILSADVSDLEKSEKELLDKIETHLTEEISMCQSVSRVYFDESELELIDSLLSDEIVIESASDLKQIEELNQH